MTDDADEPVDEEWLRSVGAYDIPLFGDDPAGLALKLIVAGREWIVAFYPDILTGRGIACWRLADGAWLPTCRNAEPGPSFITRGQVRLLCRVLGVPLNEEGKRRDGCPECRVATLAEEVERLRVENARLRAALGHCEQELAMARRRGE